MSQKEWRDPNSFSRKLEEEKGKGKNVVYLDPPPKNPPSEFYRPGHPGGQNHSPVVSSFQKCSEGEVHQNPESLTGLASLFLLVEPDDSKIKVVGFVLLAIVVSLIISYFYLRFIKIIESRKSKKIGIKEAEKNNQEQEKEDEDLGYC